MIDVRKIRAAELRSLRHTILQTFGVDLGDDEEVLARGDRSFAELVDLERAFAAFDGEQMVAGSATFDLELAIPGATLPMGGLTMVAVKPSHRRRGILRRFIDAHLEGCAARDQPVSGLWSSEAPIYGRFGFGPAGDREMLEIAADRIAVAPTAGDDAIQIYGDAATSSDAREAAIAIYDRVWPTRPGMFRRTPAWWRRRIFNLERPGASRNRARMAVTRRGGELTGYVAYNLFPERTELPSGRLDVIELIGVDAEAEASLWSFLLSVDLFPTVEWWNAPPDHLAPWLTANRRCIRRTRTDGLWLRINDVAAALSARRYAAGGVLTLAVAGEPETFELCVEDGAGVCKPGSGEPDLVFDRDALGSIYLGGVSPSLLWRAGRIRGDQARVALAGQMFAWPVAPWCCEVF